MAMATVKIMRMIGVSILFSGIALKIAGLPGYTPAFITGAVMMILSRLYQWYKTSPRS